MPYIGKSPSAGVRQRYQYTATAGQTTFSGTDLGNLTLTYTDNNFVDVFQNGVLLKGGGTDYTATSGTSVVLTTGASVSDVIEIIVYDVFSVGNFYSRTDSDSRYALTTGATMSGALDLNGQELILDADADTSITADTDDQIDFKIAGADFAKMSDQTLTLTSSTASRPGLVLLDTNADANPPFLRFQKDSASPADNDEIAAIQFYADDDGGNVFVPAQIKVVADDVSNGSENGSIRFQTAIDGTTAERMRIDGSGNVFFGTTSGTISTSGFGAAIAADGSGGFGFSRNVNYASAVMQIFGNGGEFRLMGDGAAKNTGNSYGAISDLKLKENIADSGSQWDDIKAVKVKKYSLKTDKVDKANMLGVIAQDLEASDMGGLVSDFEHEDEKGEKTGEKTKTVKYSILYMKAVKALQEAMARIETLEARIKKLEDG